MHPQTPGGGWIGSTQRGRKGLELVMRASGEGCKDGEEGWSSSAGIASMAKKDMAVATGYFEV